MSPSLPRAPETDVPAALPPRSPLLGKTAAALLGGFFIVVGLALALGMGAIAFHTAPTMLHPGVPVEGSTFTGSETQGRLFLGLFVWLIVLGVVFAAAGVNIVVSRRRQTPLTFTAAGMGLLTLVAGWVISQQKF